jgi:hypothetical protein
MPTYYRPTERRGKRVIFASIDPAEGKNQTVIGLIVFFIFLGLCLIEWLTSK